MKKTALILTALFLALGAWAQLPKAFHYQAVLRDATGNLRAAETVEVTINITQNGATIFSETHQVTTSDLGLINLNIGSVNQAAFSSINWNDTGPYMLEVLVDGVSMGTSQILSVPYAFRAEASDRADTADFAQKAGNVLTESEVDAMVANNGYTTTDTTLDEAEVDAYVANNGYLKASDLPGDEYTHVLIFNHMSSSIFNLTYYVMNTFDSLVVTIPVQGDVVLEAQGYVSFSSSMDDSNSNSVLIGTNKNYNTFFDYSLRVSDGGLKTASLQIPVNVTRTYQNLDPGTYTFYFLGKWANQKGLGTSSVSVRPTLLQAVFYPDPPKIK